MYFYDDEESCAGNELPGEDAFCHRPTHQADLWSHKWIGATGSGPSNETSGAISKEELELSDLVLETLERKESQLGALLSPVAQLIFLLSPAISSRRASVGSL